MNLLKVILDPDMIFVLVIGICTLVGAAVIMGLVLYFTYFSFLKIFSHVFTSKEEVMKGKVIDLKSRPIYLSDVVASPYGQQNEIPLFPSLFSPDNIVRTEHIMLFKNEENGKEYPLEVPPDKFNELEEQKCLWENHSIILYVKKYLFGFRLFDHFHFETESLSA